MIRSAVSIADGSLRAKFDATGYFEQATSREIVTLACGTWSGAPALDAARYCAAALPYPELRDILDRAFAFPRIAIRAAVHGPDALRWIRRNRADIGAAIEAALAQDVCGHGCPDAGPSWDRLPGWPAGYEGMGRLEDTAA